MDSSEGSRVSCSVVIPTHNAEETLGEQLRALAQQTVEFFEVVVVANNCSDSSVSVAKEFSEMLPSLRVVTANQGSGVAYARNVGTNAAATKRILLCDADDVVCESWVESMASALNDFDIVGGILDTHMLNDRRTWELLPPLPSSELPKSMKHRPYAFGGNMGYRKEVFAAVGGFDSDYIGGHEEVDFAWLAQQLGYTIGLAPDGVVFYRLRSDLRGALKQRFGSGQSYVQLYQRHQKEGINRASARHEVKAIGKFILRGPRDMRRGDGRIWLSGMAWTAGRWYGGLKYRVRPPL